MKRFNKLLCFMVVFIAVMAAFCTVSFAANIQKFDLSKWKSVQLSVDNILPAPNWQVDVTNTSVTQITNAKPTLFLSDIECNNNKIDGSFSVDDNTGDDFIGFVFGFKDTGHYYLFDWKQADQTHASYGVAKSGMSVKLVNTNSSIKDTDLWLTSGNNKVKVLYHNNIAYEDKTEYNFTLVFTDKGAFNIVIKKDNVVLDNITINDNTYTSGKFGFYNFAQGMVTYKGFAFGELPPVLEVTSVDDSKINLSWDSVEGATSYILKRSITPGGPYEMITTTSAITYTDRDVINGTTYYYVVSAVIDGTESQNSNEVSATPTGTEEPPVITGNKAILEIVMTNGTIKEYDLTAQEIENFLKWYDNRSAGTDKAYISIIKRSNVKPFESRKEYLQFKEIYSFEVKEYKE